MQIRRLKQFGLIFGCILSLFVSSVSACECSHHQGKPDSQVQEKSETNLPPCHRHRATTSRNSDVHSIQKMSCGTDCNCIQSQQQAVAKSAIYKLAKQVAIIAPVTITFIPQNIAEQINFSKPLYLSDSFYNLSPGRAPPRS